MAIRVYPGASNPSHHISLSDGVQTWGLKLKGGEDALSEVPLTPSTLKFSSGVTEFGEWEPGMAHIEQRSWHGGRGLETFSADSPTDKYRFFDSMSAWTLNEGWVAPAPQWKVAKGLSAGILDLPGDVDWEALFEDQRYLARKFTVGSDDLDAALARIWVKRVGSPEALTLSLFEDDGGEPGNAIPNSGSVVTTSEIEDVVSVFWSFDVSGMSGDLTADTDYHLVLFCGDKDNATNHWEIGVTKSNDGAHYSSDGSNWQPAGFSSYFYLRDAKLKRKFHYFELDRCLYAVDERADGSASHVYLNGDRGISTAGGSDTLTDSNKSWVEDQWMGCTVWIKSGAGEGQSRKILSNTSNQLSVEDWDTDPSSDSVYVIGGSDYWVDISPTTGDLIDGRVVDVAVVDDKVLFAQGEQNPVMRMRYNDSYPAHEFDDDGDNRADIVRGFHHLENGLQIWRGRRGSLGEVSRATPSTWLTNQSFGTAIKVGSHNEEIVDLIDFGGGLIAVKTDGLWQIDQDDQVQKIGFNLEMLPVGNVKQALCVVGEKLYLGWGRKLIRISSGRLEQLGPEIGKGSGGKRSGEISALIPLDCEKILVGVDAGDDGYSSLLVWDGSGWHELYRSPEVGARVMSLRLQTFPGRRPRLWIGSEDEVFYMDLPHNCLELLDHEGQEFQHEATLIGGSIDMGAARLPKYLKELALVSENLRAGVQVNLDIQLDGDIGAERWRELGAFYSSPLDSVEIDAGQVRSVRTRLRLKTNSGKTPPILRATVLEGFARTPLKYQWEMRIHLADLELDGGGGLSNDPDAFMAWIKRAAQDARKIRMRSIWESLDEKFVIVEPPTLRRQFSNALLGWWGGQTNLSLREA